MGHCFLFWLDPIKRPTFQSKLPPLSSDHSLPTLLSSQIWSIPMWASQSSRYQSAAPQSGHPNPYPHIQFELHPKSGPSPSVSSPSVPSKSTPLPFTLNSMSSNLAHPNPAVTNPQHHHSLPNQCPPKSDPSQSVPPPFTLNSMSSKSGLPNQLPQPFTPQSMCSRIWPIPIHTPTVHFELYVFQM
ncbi:hypothetical protein JB92DRAFT_3135100 [Gautieria morchelliformis]|nr:hypothetical protein JB92DRAFT_3135100 [Gautieria morchelliformis]